MKISKQTRNKIIVWISAIITAFVIIFITKINFIDTYIIEGHRTFILKNIVPKHNDLVIFYTQNGEQKLSRVIAVPGDSIYIRNSEVFLNSKQVSLEQEKHTYFLKGEYFRDGSVIKEIDVQNSRLKELKSIFKGLIEKKTVPRWYRQAEIFPSNEKLYQNKDNIVTYFLPVQGFEFSKIVKFPSCYTQIIERYETPEFVPENYKFQNNYYYLLNDNRNEIDDSRTFGMIPEKYIIGVVL